MVIRIPDILVLKTNSTDRSIIIGTTCITGAADGYCVELCSMLCSSGGIRYTINLWYYLLLQNTVFRRLIGGVPEARCNTEVWEIMKMPPSSVIVLIPQSKSIQSVLEIYAKKIVPMAI